MLLIIICVIVCIFAYFIIKKNIEDKKIDEDESLEETDELMTFKNENNNVKESSEENKTNDVNKTVLAPENSVSEKEIKTEDEKKDYSFNNYVKTNSSKDKDEKSIKDSTISIDDKVNADEKKNIVIQNKTSKLQAKDLSVDMSNNSREKSNRENTREKIDNFDNDKNLKNEKEDQKLEDKKIKEKNEEIPQARKNISSLDDYLNTLENPENLKNISAKLIYREYFNKDEDFHKTILNGLPTEEKEKLEAANGEYNLYDIIDFIKNTKSKATVINKKKLLNLQYTTSDKLEMEKFLGDNKLLEYKDKIDDNSNLTVTINIDKEEGKISEVTQLINLKGANYISLIKNY